MGITKAGRFQATAKTLMDAVANQLVEQEMS
jgi:hypothetical protein